MISIFIKYVVSPNKSTHMRAQYAITLVWGLLRLAQTRKASCSNKFWPKNTLHLLCMSDVSGYFLMVSAKTLCHDITYKSIPLDQFIFLSGWEENLGMRLAPPTPLLFFSFNALPSLLFSLPTSLYPLFNTTCAFTSLPFLSFLPASILYPYLLPYTIFSLPPLPLNRHCYYSDVEDASQRSSLPFRTAPQRHQLYWTCQRGHGIHTGQVL